MKLTLLFGEDEVDITLVFDLVFPFLIVLAKRGLCGALSGLFG